MASSGINKQSTWRSADAAILGISLERGAAELLSVQLAGTLRRLILEGRIGPGTKLPASRQLARELSVSRATVIAAVDQLVAEGYAEGRRGSGLYVAPDLPESLLQATPPGPALRIDAVRPAPELIVPFQPSSPDLDLFPHAVWAKLLEMTWHSPEQALLGRPDPAGWLPLRAAIADHLAAWRGIAAAPESIIVMSGMSESLELIARALLSAGSKVLVEEPGYRQLRAAFADAGLVVCPSPVDSHGFDIALAHRNWSSAVAVAVTPSRHYPLGMTMPLARRLELLEWARRRHALVIEDDYDSEYRFEGRPLPALMSLDREERVLYLGSFSKVVSTALRLAFIVAPPRFARRMIARLTEGGSKASLVPQPALAEFMRSGRFAAHIRRMRRVYASRQQALVTAARRHLAGLLDVSASPAGMHLVATMTPALSQRMSDKDASRRAAAMGVSAPALTAFYAGKPDRQGLILGYAAFDETMIERATVRLAEALGI